MPIETKNNLPSLSDEELNEAIRTLEADLATAKAEKTDRLQRDWAKVQEALAEFVSHYGSIVIEDIYDNTICIDADDPQRFPKNFVTVDIHY